jgi:hypothetical protein
MGHRRSCAVVLTAIAAAAGGAPAGAAPAVATAPAETVAAVTVSPEPGARAASPGTQISLRGEPAAALGPIEVAGARSGRHAGRIVAHSDGAGASFLPDVPFRQGERVTVRTRLSVRGARAGDYRFTVGVGDLEPRGTGRTAVPKGPLVQQSFRSRPDLRPPAVSIATRRAGHTGGEILLATKQGKRDGPLILDDRGAVVWFHPQPRGRPASDLRATTYRGQPVLTYWEGRFVVGWGFGEGVIVDSAYREVARVRAGNGFQADLHDFLLTPQGTALLLVYHRVRRGDRTLLDGIVQEVDPATGLVLFEWHALDHVGIGESYAPAPRKGRAPWDWFHVNSVAAAGGGDLIVSARNTHAVYRIDRESGAIRWRLGGRRSDFRMGRGTRFAWQHDARLHPDGTLTLFDNAAAPATRKRSRALRLRLDERRMRASLLAARAHPRGLLSPNQGGVQDLGGGRLFVGWGALSAFTEFGADGRVLFDGRLARGYDSYRAYRADWSGRPTEPPAVAAQPRGRARTAVWASWNGATEIARWLVLAGASPAALAPVETAARRGFETGISIPGRPAWVAVRAVGAGGEVLGGSAPVRPRR